MVSSNSPILFIRSITSILLYVSMSILYGQSTMIAIGSDQEYFIERMCLAYGHPPEFQRNIKPYHRKDIIDLLHYWDSLHVLQPTDKSFVKYICDENNEWLWALTKNHANTPANYVDSNLQKWNASYTASEIKYTASEKPIFNAFYKSPAHFVEANKNDFYLRLNPIANIQIGTDASSGEAIITNQRGGDLRMGLDNKLYAQTTIIENQFSFPSFFRNKISKYDAIPGTGFYKTLTQSSILKPVGYDFFIANAQMGVKVSKHFHLQFGHARHQVGDGIRSMFLSDYAGEYLYLKLNTRIWKFHYQNIFAELTTRGHNNTTSELIPRKYMASHTLQIQPLKNLNVGLFETVLFHRSNHFEFQYLNPVIIYRSVEGSIGSPDNVMLGLNARYDIKNKISIYGQALIDEFIVDEAFKNDGYWANKFGFQFGAKYINAFGVNKLDLHIEYNTARPYTYAHFDSIANYTHQSTALAHPLGANFKELVWKLRYQPTIKWHAQLYAMLYKYGEDKNNSNYGSNLFRSYNSRISDYGVKTLQGDVKDIIHIGASASYMLFHNYFIDFTAYYRKDANNPNEVTKFIGGGVRVNLWRRDLSLL